MERMSSDVEILHSEKGKSSWRLNVIQYSKEVERIWRARLWNSTKIFQHVFM